MTRINCGISPSELSDRHLLAEHREIKRIPNAIKNGRFSLTGIPLEFKLGTGHVKFFYDKLKYLHNRYRELHTECKKRRFNVTDFYESFIDLPDGLYNDYIPSDRDREIVRERIRERNGISSPETFDNMKINTKVSG